MNELLWLAGAVALAVGAALNLWRGALEHDPWLLLTEVAPEESHLYWTGLSLWEALADAIVVLAAVGLGSALPPGIMLPIVAAVLVVLVLLKPTLRALGMRYAPTVFALSRRFLKLLRWGGQLWGALGRSTTAHQHEELARRELTTVVETAHQEGALDPEEYRLVSNLIRLRNIRVSDVMTPRTVLASCPADIAVRDALRMPELRIFSRIPVWEGEPDTIIGYVLTKDLLWAALEGASELPVRQFLREVHFLPETLELDRALGAFLQRRQHLFVVVDEYGGVEGVLTLEDLIETLLGVEIVDEADQIADLRELAQQLRQQRLERLRSTLSPPARP